jgi:hypothetical protein
MSRLERDPGPQNLVGMVVWAWSRSLADDSPAALLFMLLVSVAGVLLVLLGAIAAELARAVAAGLS